MEYAANFEPVILGDGSSRHVDTSILVANEEYITSKYPIGSSQTTATESCQVNGYTGMGNLQEPPATWGADAMTPNDPGWILPENPSEANVYEFSESTLLQEILHMNKRCMRIINSVRNKKHEIIRGQWTPEEDEKLMQAVRANGMKKWPAVAGALKGRSGKQCRERWYNHLQPNIKKDGWTEEEDKILISAHKMMGNCWSEIVKCLPGRTENSVKNHWNTTKRRQLSRRPYRNSKNTYNSPLLFNYIRSLNLADDQDLNSSYSFLDSAASVDDPNKSAEVEVEVEPQPTSADSEYDFSLLPDFADVYSMEDVTQIISFGNDFLNDDFLTDGLEWDLLGTNKDLNVVNAASAANADINASAHASAKLCHPVLPTQLAPEINNNHPISQPTDQEEDFDLMEMNSACS